jgi:hypothetical protein
MDNSTSIHDIATLVASRHPLLVLESVEEERLRSLIDAAAADCGLPVFEWTITQGLRRSGDVDLNSGITAPPEKFLAHVVDMNVRAVFVAYDLHPHLQDPTTARLLRDLLRPLVQMGATLVIAGANVELPDELDTDAIRLTIALPRRDELGAMVHALVAQTGAHVGPDAMDQAAAALQGLTLNQARQAVTMALLDGALEAGDMPALLDRKVRVIAEDGLLEYFAPNDNDAQLAGLNGLKQWLARALTAFTPEARQMNIEPPRGILLAGVPGCGKSLAAKFIAREWGRPLLKLDAARLYDKYVGESERNLREVLRLAESLAPIVLWIDEIEKGLAVGGDDASGATSRRMLGTLLTWMSEPRADIFLVATSNDLSALPVELQRKGRFDEVFFVDLPTPRERAAIFGTQLSGRRQSREHFDLRVLVSETNGFSGAEIEQVVVAGLLRALHARRVADTAALLDEIAATVPLSRSRADEIAAIRARARDFVPASEG